MSFFINGTKVKEITVIKGGEPIDIDEFYVRNSQTGELTRVLYPFWKCELQLTGQTNLPDSNWISSTLDNTIGVEYGKSSGYFQVSSSTQKNYIYQAYFKIDLSKFRYMDISKGSKNLSALAYGYSTVTGKMASSPSESLIVSASNPVTNIDLSEYLAKNPTRKYVCIYCNISSSGASAVITLHN